MTLDERIKNTIGDLVMQLHGALAKVEELEAQMETMIEKPLEKPAE